METNDKTSRQWSPEEIPLDKPSASRIYDYLLGGYHNFASDRQVTDQLLQLNPDMGLAAQVNRGFLRRAVTYLLSQGIDQFLDIGSGIPTVGNVHQVAQTSNPEARVVYVDVDPVAVAHSQAILVDNPRATAIRADVRQPETILAHDEVQRLLDFERPIGLLMVALLHYVVGDEIAYPVVSTLRAAMTPGSYLVVAHSLLELQGGDKGEQVAETFRAASNSQYRTEAQIRRFFGDWDLVEPGLVYTPLWRPEGPDDVFLDDPGRGLTMAGVARKP
ncbi:MAG: SAM-dependent methyltransferase [Anaerolineae bacterium]